MLGPFGGFRCFDNHQLINGTKHVHPPNWSKKTKFKKSSKTIKNLDDLMVKRFKEVCEVHSGLCDVQESACFKVFCLWHYYYFVHASSFFLLLSIFCIVCRDLQERARQRNGLWGEVASKLGDTALIVLSCFKPVIFSVSPRSAR
jgi:hypothetical protein